MCAVKSGGCVVVRVGILGEVPSANDAKPVPKSAAQRVMIVGNPAVDHGHSLARAVESERILYIGEARPVVNIRQGLIDLAKLVLGLIDEHVVQIQLAERLCR